MKDPRKHEMTWITVA